MDILLNTLQSTMPSIRSGETSDFNWRWCLDGVFEMTPKTHYDKAIVLSAGIHGNETAPIELLDLLCRDLFSNILCLNVRLLIIFGNPQAIQQGKRYIENDMNRLFGEDSENYLDSESQRAKQLKHCVVEFFNSSQKQAIYYHYDLHTAIRESNFPIFAMLPYQTQPYNTSLLDGLNRANLDAVVYHNELGKTFTHFTSETCQSASVTLELGKARPFGENNLAEFTAIDQMLRATISNTVLPQRTKIKMATFEVVQSVIKSTEQFQLNLPNEAPNFSIFQLNELIATDGTKKIIANDNLYILFPNPKVKLGLRAGLLLKKVNF